MQKYDRFTDDELLAWLEAGGWCSPWSLYAAEAARLFRMSKLGYCKYYRGVAVDGKVMRGWFLTAEGEAHLYRRAPPQSENHPGKA